MNSENRLSDYVSTLSEGKAGGASLNMDVEIGIEDAISTNTVRRRRAATAPVRSIRLTWSNLTATVPAKSAGILGRWKRSNQFAPEKNILEDSKNACREALFHICVCIRSPCLVYS